MFVLFSRWSTDWSSDGQFRSSSVNAEPSTLYFGGRRAKNRVPGALSLLLKYLFIYWHCPRCMRSRVYLTVRCPSVRLSVCSSVPSIDSSSRSTFAAGRRRRSAANAGSVMLRAEGRGSTQTCFTLSPFYSRSFYLYKIKPLF